MDYPTLSVWLVEIFMSRIAFAEDDSRFNDELRLYGLGHEEIMPAGFVSRRRGFPAYLLVLFHDDVVAELNGKMTNLASGTLVLWNRNTPHYFGHATNSWNHSWVVFSGSTWNDDAVWLSPLVEVPQYFSDERFLRDGFFRLLREFEEMEQPCLPIVAGNVQLLLRELGRGKEMALNAGLMLDPVRRAGRWITGNLKEKITVGEVARYAGLSPSRLQQLFHKKHACSVQVWIEQQRLREVRYWLMHSGLSMSEIAELTGFSDSFYLSRRFSMSFGQSPSAYRKLHYGEAPDPDALPIHN